MLSGNLYIYVLILPFKVVCCGVGIIDNDVFGFTMQFHPTSSREELGPADILKFALERPIALDHVC